MLTAKEFLVFDTKKNLFNQLRDKTIFVSGGTGFFGKWLLESFQYVNKAFELNASMTILSRHKLKDEPALTFIQGDARDFTFPAGKYDFIIHAAPVGTRRVLDFAIKAGTSRFMMTSSGAVYGPQPPQMSHLPETYSCSPSTAYGKDKLLAEEICVEAGNRHGFSVLLPRCFAFVGPYLDLDIHYAVGNFIRDCLEDRPVKIKGDGTTVRSYLYAADLAEWLWTILLKGARWRPYNVGSAQEITIRDLAYRVRDCAETSNLVEIMGETISGTGPQRYVPSVERASSELNLGPRYSLDEAISRTLAWHKKRIK